LAEKSSQKSIWVTLGAAFGTIVVILGIAAGPTAVSCASDDAGFGTCVRERLADFGLLKQPSTPPVGEPAALKAASPDASSEQPVVTEIEDAPPVVEKSVEPEPVTPTPVAPTLGLVRAEPNGDLVIAGSATPGARVAVYAGDVLLGETTAEASGDWVLVPEVPLAPGGAEITVRSVDTGLVAKQSVVVVIQDDLTTEPLVVAGAPGQASKVLQGLAPVESDAAPAQTVADAGDQTTANVAEPVAADASDNADPAAETVETPAEVAAPPTETIVVAETPATKAPADEAPAPAKTPEAGKSPVVPETVKKDTVVATATDTVSPETPLTETQPAAKADVAPEQPVAAPVEAPVVVAAVVPPSIDAIEVDGNRNFFAGSGPEGATVRLYVDDKFVADSVVSNGRWLVETDENVLTSPTQRIRVDMLKDGSADVAARAEVDFEITLPDLPEVEPPIIVAEAPAADEPEAETPKAEAPKVDAPKVDAPKPNAPQADVVAPINGATTPKNDDIVVDTPAVATQPATPAQPTPTTAPATPVETTDANNVAVPAKPTGGATEAQTSTPVETVDAEKVPTLTAVSVGDPEAQRFASGKAIIRSGDNLWTIAGRVYGSGYRYLTIYRANQGQITNPNLIYPGQVFELPTE